MLCCLRPESFMYQLNTKIFSNELSIDTYIQLLLGFFVQQALSTYGAISTCYTLLKSYEQNKNIDESLVSHAQLLLHVQVVIGATACFSSIFWTIYINYRAQSHLKKKLTCKEAVIQFDFSFLIYRLINIVVTLYDKTQRSDNFCYKKTVLYGLAWPFMMVLFIPGVFVLPLIPFLDLADLGLEIAIIIAFNDLNKDYTSTRTTRSFKSAEGLIEGHELPLLTREFSLLIVACLFSIFVDIGEFLALFNNILLKAKDERIILSKDQHDNLTSRNLEGQSQAGQSQDVDNQV